MRSSLLALGILAALGPSASLRAQSAPPAFTVAQVMSAPYALALTASPVGARFAWIENAEGVRNIWIAGPHEAARQLTHYTEDDGQDITGLAWSPDGASLAYTLGAESGAGGKPANPAELQRPTALRVWVQSLTAARPTLIGEGHAPLFHGDKLLFIRAGQIWEAEASVPTQAAQPTPAHQLVFDRGSASGLTLSPDGKLLAYSSHRRGHSFIALYSFTVGTLRFVSPSTSSDSAPAFSRDGKQLAWLREPFTDAPEFAANRVSANPWSVQVADVSGLQARTVYQPEANKPGSVIPRFATGNPRVWWGAGDKLLFCSEADGWNHLYSIDTLAPTAKPVLLSPGDGEVEDVSVTPDGMQVLWAANMQPLIFSYDGILACEPVARHLLEADTDRRHLWQLDLDQPKSRAQPLTTGEGIETRPLKLADGSVIALASTAFVPMHPMMLTEYSNVMKPVRADWLPATYPEAKLVFPHQVLLPFTDGNSQPPGAKSSSERPVVHAQLFLPGDTKAVAGDPLPICNGHATRPVEKHPKLRPAIVFFHGGPRRQLLLGYPAMDYYSNAYAMNQYLASRGFLVLSVNYRCGIGYGTDFRQCEHAGADGAAEYNDALAAVDYLRSRGDVDMQRVGIWGGSYGGYFTALGLARNSNLFAAGVDFHGVHDWIVEDNRDDWLRGTDSEKDAIARRAHASSPMADVDRWRSPVLLIHGDDDPEVTYNQTPLLADALRARGVHVEELIFPDEVHDFLLHRDWVRAYEATADFFERTLKPSAAATAGAPPANAHPR